MRNTPLIAFVIGLVAGGIGTWIHPYDEVLIWGMDYRALMAVAVLIFSCLYKFLMKSRISNSARFIGFGATTALVIRIIYDVSVISISHPDWLLEIVLFALIAFFSAFLGTYLGELLILTKRSRTG